MVAQRQPVDRVIDLVVGFPVASAVAARRSIPLIRQASREGVRMVAQRARQTLGSAHDTSGVPAAALVTSADRTSGVQAAVAEPAAPELEVALEPVLPIDGYDHLAARQVVDRLVTLTAAELAQIDVYERAHRHRQTVLGRIAQLKP